MLLLSLSDGHKIGLGAGGAVFIVFALASSFLLPRRRPDFPGSGRNLFIAVTAVLFVAMLAAVEIFAKEGKESAAAEKTAGQAVGVAAKEFSLKVSISRLSTGETVFRLRNAGRIGHDLTIAGPGISKAATPVIGAGKTAELKVTLAAGTYELYCSVPGHRQAGMDATVVVA